MMSTVYRVGLDTRVFPTGVRFDDRQAAESIYFALVEARTEPVAEVWVETTDLCGSVRRFYAPDVRSFTEVQELDEAKGE